MRALVVGVGLWAACGSTAGVVPDEQGLTCSDGVDNDDDGRTDCEEAACEALPVCTCGNGALDVGEICDDGNDDDDDACLNRCVPARCGDAIVARGQEECDDGNDDDEDGCLAGCVAATCGDGVVWAGQETCDDANGVETDTCRNSCAMAACGDGVVWAGFEGCDDANLDDTDACRNDCVLATCGDGQIQLNEACDDDNAINTDGCLNSCLLPQCGDGFVWNGQEACDDGNFTNEDGCVACEVAVCGDGFVQAGVEACDDSNAAAGDGCSDACGLELVNGGFEDDVPLRGWTVERVGPGTAAWGVVAAGDKIGDSDFVFDALEGVDFTTACASAGFGDPGLTAAPFEGGRAALATQITVGAQRMFQDITIVPGRTKLTWAMSWASFDVLAGSQSFRVAVLDPKTNEVARELFQPDGGGVFGWATYEAALDDFVGQTVRLEIDMVVSMFCMPLFLDDFRID